MDTQITDLNSCSGAEERPRAKLDRRRCLGANLFVQRINKASEEQNCFEVGRLVKCTRVCARVKPKWKQMNAADAVLCL